MRTDWKDRLNNWAPEPPSTAWDILSERLAEETSPGLVQKLQNLSAQPPVMVWHNIASELDANKTPVISIKPQQPWLRYAGIAAAVLAIFFGVRNYPESTNQPNLPTTRTNSVLPSVVVKSPEPEVAISSETVSASVLPVSSGTAATIKLPPVPKIATRSPLAPQNVTFALRSDRIYRVVAAHIPRVDGSMLDRYIVVATNEDAAVRLPKKVFDLFRCDNTPDVAACSERLTSLRRKAAAPTLVAAADFTGLLEIIRNVETLK